VQQLAGLVVEVAERMGEDVRLGLDERQGERLKSAWARRQLSKSPGAGR
jgi:hypothetical protein